MARQSLSITDLTLGAGVLSSIGGTIVPADGGLIPAGGKTRNLFLHVTAGTIAGTLYIKAGDNPPGFRKGLGDVTQVLTANQQVFLPIESARHAKTNGDIYIESVGNLVVVTPYRMPSDV